MKILFLSLLLLLPTTTPLLADEIESIPVHKETGPKLVQSYQDVLAVIPQEYSPAEAKKWTEVKKSLVNGLLKENLVDSHAPAKFRAKVCEVAWWPGLTLFWEIPNEEGYHIRLFAGFTDDWKARLSMLNIGDEVIVEGTLNKVAYEKLWNADTLTICVAPSTFSRADASASDQVRVTSAVFGTESKFADVTQRVNQWLHPQSRTFAVNPDSLGADPAYGEVKSLVIVYEIQGQRHLYSTTEGSEVNAEVLIEAAKQ